MPELPEVETVRRGLAPKLTGRRIVRVDVHEARLRFPVDARALRARLTGRRIACLSRRAKYLLVHLEPGGPGGDMRLVFHLGMSGRLVLAREGMPLEPHTHVVFALDGGCELRFRDHRRFGLVAAMGAEEIAADPRFRDLGVEPLSGEFTGEYLWGRSRGLRRPVKTFLMDSHEVAGIGNIYASEALHAAGVHPLRAAGRLGRVRWERVVKAVQEVLEQAIREGGTTLADFHHPEGGTGYFQVSLRVYGREGAPCQRCSAGTVRRRVLAGRSTFYCPTCQR